MYVKYSHLSKFGTMIWDKMPLPGQHQCSQFGSCHMQVLTSFSRYKLLTPPFRDAESNKMNTCILQCTFMSFTGTFMSFSGRRTGAGCFRFNVQQS